MNKIILIFIVSIGTVFPGYSLADSVVPPTGPYRSSNENLPANEQTGGEYNADVNNINSSSSRRVNRNLQGELLVIPEWVKKRQTDMSKALQQQDTQPVIQRYGRSNYQSAPMPNQNHQAMQQWNQRQMMPMNIPPQRVTPQAVNPQNTRPQINRMKQYFPAARGPVYGPNVPPPAGYNNPNYRNNSPANMYPPVWR